MFIRGTGFGQEYRRDDNKFYKGIVVKNNDPLRLNRIKIYIPELSNQPFDEWFNEFDNINVKYPGINNTGNNWKDVGIYEEISETIPWAEPCYPIIGESGNARYNKEYKLVSISDSNYLMGLSAVNSEPITLENGGFSPAFLYENKDTRMPDVYVNPIASYTAIPNPYGFLYSPSKHVNKSKGVFGVPEIGSKVWVFHWQGNLQFPVYFGSYKDFRELTLINNTDNSTKISMSYPGEFETHV